MRQRAARGSNDQAPELCEKLTLAVQTLRWSVVSELPFRRGAQHRPRCGYNRMIITVSGPHGTGKSTYASRIASSLGIRHLSAGLVFRRLAREKEISLEEFGQMALKDPSIDKLIDERTVQEAAKGNVVLDGQLTGWILKDTANLKIYLTAPETVRLERIARRDKMTLKEAGAQTRIREAVQRRRYLKHYGFRVDDKSIYHLVFDTSLGSIGDTAKVLIAAARIVKNAERNGARKKP